MAAVVALEAAADIAHARAAEVLGIFVEEVNLLRSAGYAFAREVGASSGRARPLDLPMIEARMRALTEQARRSLEATMDRRGIPRSLKLCRGQVVSEVLGLAQPDDLLILGRVGWYGPPGARLGSTARSLLRQAPGDVLVWTQPRQRPQSRVAVLLNHDRNANQRALRLSLELALRHHQPLTVLIPAGAEDDPPSTGELLSVLQQEGIPARVRLIPSGSAAVISRALQAEGASQLVVSRESGLWNAPGADTMLQQLNLPLTVTR
ncbi:MAG: universal stress protein [Marinobacter sp.]